MNYVGGKLIGRFTEAVPTTLFRMQSGKRAALRPHHLQVAKGSPSFDLHLHDGKVLPMDPADDVFRGPNGMSLRPKGQMFAVLLDRFKGNHVYEIPGGTELPKSLVLLHEHTDHYSLQTTAPVTLEELNSVLTRFLSKATGVRHYPTKDEFYAAHADMRPDGEGFW
jgi:hypothetical protein